MVDMNTKAIQCIFRFKVKKLTVEMQVRRAHGEIPSSLNAIIASICAQIRERDTVVRHPSNLVRIERSSGRVRRVHIFDCRNPGISPGIRARRLILSLLLKNCCEENVHGAGVIVLSFPGTGESRVDLRGVEVEDCAVVKQHVFMLRCSILHRL